MWHKLETLEQWSGAAGNAVADLSRRTFILKVGAIASSLIAGASVLAARGAMMIECRHIPGQQVVRGPAKFSSKVCVPAGTCNPPNQAAVDAAGLKICKDFQQHKCDEGRCDIPQQCRAIVVAGSTLRVSSAKDLGRLDCPLGQTTCVIDFDLREGPPAEFINCACECAN